VNLEGKRLKRLIDPGLASALAHPLRGHILITAAELGEVSPAHVGAELEIPVYSTSYHFKRLRLGRLISQVRTEQRRGFTEHFYSLVEPIFHFDDEEWKQIPRQFRDAISGELTVNVLKELRAAFEAGTLSAEDAHFSRVWIRTDEQAREELREVDREALERKLEIKRSCERRLAGTEPTAGVQMTFLTASFESAPAHD
jgi:predicted ArsR family transcriptional regulator